jgi:predicted O-linked N-acetylglucosamine transferase (SPINDLY family)
LKRLDDALTHLDRALAIDPAHVQAQLNRGLVLFDMGRNEEALAGLNRVVALKPDLVDAYMNRGSVLNVMKRRAEAIADWEKALELKPGLAFIRGEVLRTKRTMCMWDGDAEALALIDQRVAEGKGVIMPFAYLTATDDPKLALICAKIYAAATCAVPFQLTPSPPTGDKIKIAFLSSDFYNHALGILAVEVFERLDRRRFETCAICFSPPHDDDMRTRFRSAFDRFIDVNQMSDEAAAQTIADWGAHIAVDLTGFASASRTRILAYRPAPVQVSYLGFAGSMGTPIFDYIIADPHVIPPGDERYYAERVARLPHTYQANQSQRAVINDDRTTRAIHGLPDNAFVFCCFNNSHKITPQMFGIWMRILARTPGSVLWLFKDNDDAERNLRREAAARGIDAQRLFFAPRIDGREHLRRHMCADLFLDTLPFNAHTTASDALWMGLPVLTCTGRTFAGRVAASLLRAIDLPELVTHSLADYEEMAVQLALDPARLKAVRETLARNRNSTPLFDCARYTRHLEAAFEVMYRRWRDGLPPEAFDIASEC